MTTYRTYFKERFDVGYIKPIQKDNSIMNKPRGGLWGCKGTEWYDWCVAEDFALYSKFIEWELDESAKVLLLNDLEDLREVQIKYGTPAEFSNKVRIIDWTKVAEDYDAVETTPHAAYDLHLAHTDTDYIGYNTWDVPSICIWNLDKVSFKKIMVV